MSQQDGLWGPLGTVDLNCRLTGSGVTLWALRVTAREAKEKERPSGTPLSFPGRRCSRSLEVPQSCEVTVAATAPHHPHPQPPFPLSASAWLGTGLLVGCQPTQLTPWGWEGLWWPDDVGVSGWAFLWMVHPWERACRCWHLSLKQGHSRGGEGGAQPHPVTTHPARPSSVGGHLEPSLCPWKGGGQVRMGALTGLATKTSPRGGSRSVGSVCRHSSCPRPQPCPFCFQIGGHSPPAWGLHVGSLLSPPPAKGRIPHLLRGSLGAPLWWA